jgi:Flp pilus assembly protein TadD
MSKRSSTPPRAGISSPPLRDADSFLRGPRWHIWAALLLSAVFLRTLGHGFVNFDDDLYVTDNLWVKQGLSLAGLRWAFFGSAAANWHPLTWLSHMADCQFFGLRPWGHHLVSALLHTVNTGLLFLVLRRITQAPWRSFFVAAVFAIHPLHVESVAWISERKDVLSGFFFMLTLGAYARYVEQAVSQRSKVGVQKTEAGRSSGFQLPYSSYYFWTLGFFALGLMSKPMLVTVPCLLLLLDYWPFRRGVAGEAELPGSNKLDALRVRARCWEGLVWEKAPFFALAACSSLITYVVQKRAGAMWTLSEVPFSERIGNALVAYWRYLGKFFCPTRLSVFYPHPGQWPVAPVLVSGLMLLAVTALALRLRQRAPFFLVGWLWFLGTLVPVIGLVQVGWQSLADRYMYIPMIGLLLAGIWGMELLTATWSARMVPMLVAGTGLLGMGAVLAWEQAGYWKDSETLFRHALRVTDNNFIAHHNLGMALMSEGRLDEAAVEFGAALKLRPKSADSYNGLGEVLLRQGHMDEAMALFDKAISFKPDLAVAYNNLGIIRSRKGMVDQAILDFEHALKARPGYVKAFNNLGLALQADGRLDEAILKLQEAVRLAPEDAEAHKNFGMALGRKGRLDEAVEQLTLAIKINPKDSQARHNLGLAFSRQGRMEDAIGQFERALELKPDSAETHACLGLALAQVKRKEQAIEHFKQALKLKPNNPEVEQQLKTLTGGASF